MKKRLFFVFDPIVIAAVGAAALLFIVFLAAGCAGNTREVKCAKSVPVPSEDSRVLSVSQAQSITTTLTVAEIYALLGPPARDNCSGLYCPEWDVADGSTLLVRFASGCDRPLEVRLRGAMH